MVPLVVKWVDWNVGEARASFQGRLKKSFQPCHSSQWFPMKPAVIGRGIERVSRHSAQKQKSLLPELGQALYLLSKPGDSERAWFYKIIVLIMVLEICCIQGCPSLINSFLYGKILILKSRLLSTEVRMKIPSIPCSSFTGMLFPPCKT